MDLSDKIIALIATDNFEDSELTVPMQELEAAGAEVRVISSTAESITGQDGTEVPVEMTFAEVDASDYDALLIPGGVGNPDTLRMDKKAVAFVKAFVDSGKPVAAICHGPWLLVEADVVDGHRVTSWPSLKTDLVNAGGEWVDEAVVVDDNIITSRNPDDIPAFIEAVRQSLAKKAE